jgi:hypothetical protein
LPNAGIVYFDPKAAWAEALISCDVIRGPNPHSPSEEQGQKQIPSLRSGMPNKRASNGKCGDSSLRSE